MKSLAWTSRDLEMMPDDGKLYEIVDGELYVSKQPHYHHQHLCLRLAEYSMHGAFRQVGEK